MAKHYIASIRSLIKTILVLTIPCQNRICGAETFTGPTEGFQLLKQASQAKLTGLLKPGDKANMVLISPGEFVMGSPTTEAGRNSGGDGRNSSETLHKVTFTYAFYVGRFEVTQNEYQDVMGVNPSYHVTEDQNLPVENVSWVDATNYCYQVTLRQRALGYIDTEWEYRLPTETEWEYACRAGTTSAFCYGNELRSGMASFWGQEEYVSSIGTEYNPNGDHPNIQTPVGSYAPNAWGIFDMHGNVAEWTLDDLGANETGASMMDPTGTLNNKMPYRYRGGAYTFYGAATRSAFRDHIGNITTSYAVGFRVVLARILPDWKAAILRMPSQPVYGNAPIKRVSVDSLVVITHGWQPHLFGKYPPPDVGFVDAMSNSISSYLKDHQKMTWQVQGYKWVENAWKFDPQNALNNAKQEGVHLGNSIVVQGWTNVHLISHSAGAALIQSATEIIKQNKPNTVVHCTFLDPFVGWMQDERGTYGNEADWSDNYFSRDISTGAAKWSLTQGSLDHAYNIDVTQLDPHKLTINKFRSNQNAEVTWCQVTLTSHGWPIDFYSNTISKNVSPKYAGFGFPLSAEAGNFKYGKEHFIPGNNPPQPVGDPDKVCAIAALTSSSPLISVPLDFTRIASIQSDTGKIETFPDHINLLTGSPVWLVTQILSTNLQDSVSFDVQFTNETGCVGLLSIYSGTNVIGWVDQRAVGTRLRHYYFKLATLTSKVNRTLGFRLDSYGVGQSSATLTNLVVHEIKWGQPCLLNAAKSTINGLLAYDLAFEPGINYEIQASANFIDWMSIGEVLGTNGTATFFDQSQTNYSNRFYRAVSF